MAITLTTVATGSAGNCYVLRSPSSALVLEAGVKPIDALRAANIKLHDVAAVLITHEHLDHAKYAGMWAYRYHRPVYCSIGTASMLPKPGIYRTSIFGELLMEDQWHITPFAVHHDASQPVGWYIVHGEERILFVTDTAPIDYCFKSCRPTTIMVESNWHVGSLELMDNSGLAPRIATSHLSDEMAADLIRANLTGDLKHVVLLHLSDDNAQEAEAVLMAQQAAPMANIYAARAGQTIDLSSTFFNQKIETK